VRDILPPGCRYRFEASGTFHLHFAQRRERSNREARRDDRPARQESSSLILGLRILDNMIVARKGFFSFQEAGLIP
jgi:hypothetical protein